MTRYLLLLSLPLAACGDFHRSTLDAPASADPGRPDEVVPVQPDDEQTARQWQPAGEFPVLVEGTWLEGRFGFADAVDAPPDQIETSTWADESFFTLHTVDADWTMFQVRLAGELGVAPYVPGNRVYFRSDIDPEVDASQPEGVTGCSGPSMHEFDVDEYTTDVVVDVDVDADGQLVLEVAADFGSNGDLTATLVFE